MASALLQTEAVSLLQCWSPPGHLRDSQGTSTPRKAAKLIGLKSRHVVALAVLVATLVVGMPVGVRADEKPSNPQAEQLQAQLVEMRKQMDAMQKELDSKDIPPERRTMLRHDMDSMRHNWQDMHNHCRW